MPHDISPPMFARGLLYVPHAVRPDAETSIALQDRLANPGLAD
jgi:hypothetical protein